MNRAAMNAANDEFFVVIRSAQERSLPLCVNAVQAQTGNFTAIEEYPFLNAVRKTFELGAQQEHPFLLALDADVILYPNALDTILEDARVFLREEPLLLCLDFQVKDKFRGRVLAGGHLYVNKYAKELASHFERLADDPLQSRPERSNLLAFANARYLLIVNNSREVGLHDYEQYYNHLYVKYYRRAIRWPEYIAANLAAVEQLRYLHPDDLDLEVVLESLKAGMGKKEVPFDARLYPSIEQLMGISEKSLLLKA